MVSRDIIADDPPVLDAAERGNTWETSSISHIEVTLLVSEGITKPMKIVVCLGCMKHIVL